MLPMLIEDLAQTMLNLAGLAAIPLLWHRNSKQKAQSFFAWLGIHRPQISDPWGIVRILGAVSAVALAGTLAVLLSHHSSLNPIGLAGYSVGSYLLSLLVMGLRSGTGEEMFFRGFIGKRLIRKLGFAWGNILQALIFGLCHYSLMSNGSLSVADRIDRVISASLLGYAFGYVTERKCGGSIIPAMAAHALFNIVASITLAAVMAPSFFGI